MKLPISYAINYPERTIDVTPELDLFKYNNLTFDKPDRETFKCLDIAVNAVKKGGLVPTIMNAANEVAVEMFLKDKIGFLDIAGLIDNTIKGITVTDELSFDSIVNYDNLSREYCRSLI